MNVSLLTFLWVVGVAAVGGLVSYLNKPEPKTIGGVCTVILTSGFTGFMAYCLCVESEQSSGMTTLIVGVVGMMGKRAGDDFQSMVLNRLGIIFADRTPVRQNNEQNS